MVESTIRFVGNILGNFGNFGNVGNFVKLFKLLKTMIFNRKTGLALKQ